jgi:ankyrin repeat protein
MSTANGNDDNKDLLATSTKEDAQRLSIVDQLFAACKSGDVNNASRLLAALPEVNLNTIKWSKDDEGALTLLTHAARKGHAEICQMLLDKGAEVNQRSEGNYYLSSERTSPLINACRYGHSKVVNVLLAVGGIDVNYRKGDGATGLIASCRMGHSKVVELLLAAGGIRVNQANDEEVTPLYIASQGGHSKVVELLLAVDGIQVNKATDEEATPLYIACQNGHLKVVKMLLAVDGIQVNLTDNEATSPLGVASNYAQSKVVQMLLAVDGIQVNQANNHGFTPLMAALSKSHLDIVIQLLQHGIGHNSINEWFSINKIKPSGRIALYKYAVLLPRQHQPLLDFHSCVLSSTNALVPTSTTALVPTSALKVFKTIWPPLIGFTIESFLLPTKQTRRTMQHVISQFNATLNAYNEREETQLYRAVLLTEVESVRFLILQDGILINKINKVVYEGEGEDDATHYETPLQLAEDLVREGAADDTVSDDVGTKRMYIAGLLRDAGGVTHT